MSHAREPIQTAMNLSRTQETQSLLMRCPALLRHPVVRNVGALYAAQAARYLVPLALVPYLARALRPEAFGRLAIAQSLAAILGVAVEFGSMLSATREVARERSSPRALESIAAGVLGGKALLAGGTAAICLVLDAFVPQFNHAPQFLWGACLLAVAQGTTPAWFFQGIEQMALQTGIDLAGSVAGAAAIFVFVKGPPDAALPLYIMGAFALVSVFTNHVRMYRRIRYSRPRLRETAKELRRSTSMFVLRISITLYTGANVFLLGLYLPAAAVAQFAGAEKIARSAGSLIFPASQALFPRISHIVAGDEIRGRKIARRVLAIYVGAAIPACVVLAWSAPLAVRVALGPGYAAAVPLLRWLAALVLLIAVNNTICTLVLLPLGMDAAVNVVVGTAAALNVASALILIPNFGALGMVWSEIGSETAGAVVAIWLLSRRRHPASPTKLDAPASAGVGNA